MAQNEASGAELPASKKLAHALREERILAFWERNKIFKKTLEKEAPKGEYTFYDGPPFATGTPHYGHLVPGTIKDIIPRFKTMQGYRVARRWGWDCHGLPVENLVEKDLNLGTKKDILTYGIGKFNEAARSTVMKFADEWRHIIPRLGRFVDMDDDYRTMDCTYTESVWSIFKKLHDAGHIYEGFKIMNLCPRCETTLSNFEVAQGYKDITDISVYAKFLLKPDKTGAHDGSAEKTYFLAWTTTPWTLPGNVALAVNPQISYVKIRISEGEDQKKGMYILSKERLDVLSKGILKDLKFEIVQTMPGSELIGLEYQPMFNYYSGQKNLPHLENGWQILGADFVTTENGTGIVHIAPAFGADDYELLKKHELPFVQHVAVDGHFKPEVTDFVGMPVKPKDTDEDKNAHQKADIEIIKWLSHNGFLFEKEKLIHSYPHCWRCDTPLLNYAASSWFVRVSEFKDKLVKENSKVTWVPPEVGEGRFGNWLLGARDWAISRSRFWGAPIPVWRIEEKKHLPNPAALGDQDKKEGSKDGDVPGTVVIGSIEDLKKYSHPKNTYYVMRHGEALLNVQGILNSDRTIPSHLTDHGKKQIKKNARVLKGSHIDIIFCSPFIRTEETAHLMSEELGLKRGDVIIDERLRELGQGEFNGKTVEEFSKGYPLENRFEAGPAGCEDYGSVKKRMGDFLYEMEKRYTGKTILFVTHGCPAMLLLAAAEGLNRKDSLRLENEKYISKAEIRKIDFVPLPHNSEYELDLHRPYIDDLDLKTSDGRAMVRVGDVFDCWFESGAMPYGSNHYPFENLDEFDPKGGLFHKSKRFPADFIAEGLDQTRGWFYSMLVLGVALFGKSPYKKVIVSGLVLAEDGQKMAKSKKNFPDPLVVVDKYGADSLRFYLMSSPVVRGQDLRFSEKGVDEVTKKVVNRLLNVLTFFEMYEEDKKHESGINPPAGGQSSRHILDKWVMSRLNETIGQVTDALQDGEIDRASRPFHDLVEDLSTWYLRRSRDRFKGEDIEDKKSAITTTRTVLLETSKLIAPFMPFLAEEIYGRIKGPKESVHLEVWPEAGHVETDLQKSMALVRDIASKGLEARMKAGINVRQPLSALRVKKYEATSKNADTDQQLLELIKDEVNVKKVTVDPAIPTELELDTVLTPELKEEGTVREFIRAIQDMRKEKGLYVDDQATLKVETNGLGRQFIEKYEKEFMRTASLKSVNFTSVEGEEISFGDIKAKLSLE
jgi:isoleucyl-tRNA synthetase